MSLSRKTIPLMFVNQPRNTLIPQVLVFIYLLAALIIAAIVPFLAEDWARTPFLGSYFEQSMILSRIQPIEKIPNWTINNLRIGEGIDYQLVSVAGFKVNNPTDLQSILRNHSVNDIVDATLQEVITNGQTINASIRLIALPDTDKTTLIYIPYLIGLIYLASAVWIFVIRRKQAVGQAYAIFGASAALVTACIFDLFTTHWFAWAWTAALALTGGGMAALMLRFPSDDPMTINRPWARYLGYGLSILLAIFGLFGLSKTSGFLSYSMVWKVEAGFTGLTIVIAFSWLIFRRMRNTMPMEKEQIRLVLIGGLVSFGPLALWLLLTSLFPQQLVFSPYLLILLAVFPVTVGYTVQRYRLMQTDYVMSRAVMYGMMGVLVTIGYALFVSGITLLFSSLIAPDNPIITGLILFVIALVFMPGRQWFSRRIDMIFFRGQRAYQERLQSFSGELTNIIDLKAITRILRVYIENTLQPDRLHIFLYDPLIDAFGATQDQNGKPTTDLRFPLNSGLIQKLGNHTKPLFAAEIDVQSSGFQADHARLALLGAQLFAPLSGRLRLSGWLALGSRLSGEPYTSRELGFLDALCDQASLAIERAQVVVNMENRVREMNMLSRVSQGINITLEMNDILELIYAQTTQIIPADLFQLVLMDNESGQLVPLFYVEGEERLNERENKPILQQILEQEVVRTQRSIITDDYRRECQKRGIPPTNNQLFAWIGVPLNAGSSSIGCMSLGSYESTVTYTSEQLNLLQAIADQVAGAFVKARLLQETERRARQLTTLNEVTRQLTSTLELEPLLETILQSATEILNCEAGSLLLVDQQTDELVFRVVLGPASGDLLNTRMPPGAGLVGRAVRDQKSVVVNNVQNSPDWYKQADKKTGFITRGLLVIPLMVKDRVIGVIEVLNKKDMQPFGREDEQLLSAFAAQAAVAIENARLYTMTDQALAARVEELSVMQRIDRELNTSLDTTRAMRITLDWAIRQSNSPAGLVGVIHESGLKIMASQGYTDELEPFVNALLPIEEFGLTESIEKGLPIRNLVENIEKAILKGACSQMVVPIRREAVTIGLVILESPKQEPVSTETFSFLQRLSDHASIAISNAQLYNAVQSANAAKSEFVSFVAHELKNPMTSIKGYTDLLAAGAVGPITDMQTNFLSTIRANIDRMNTLISDLNDLSKIEAGRLKLDFKAVIVREVVDETVRSTKRQIDEKSQQLQINLPDNLPNVWADRVRIAQVLVNLVSNAYKYTPSGGLIIVGAEAGDNTWDPEGAKKVVHLWVQDNGLGIGPEDQKKIFQKFFRSEDPKSRESPGTGLGLNITKSLVEMQGGKIWFDSEFRKGTTFHVTIPIAE